MVVTHTVQVVALLVVDHHTVGVPLEKQTLRGILHQILVTTHSTLVILVLVGMFLVALVGVVLVVLEDQPVLEVQAVLVDQAVVVVGVLLLSVRDHHRVLGKFHLIM